MTRRNSTSRRVQTLSPVSVRPCEIAATDMALSRGVWSRDGISDMPVAAQRMFHEVSHDRSERQNQLCLRWITAAIADRASVAQSQRRAEISSFRLRGARAT